MISRPTVSLNDPNFDSLQVIPSEPYRRSRPVLIDASDDIKKAVQQNIDVEPVTPPEARVGCLKNIVVLKRGILVEETGKIIKESLINMDDLARFEAEIASIYDHALTNVGILPVVPYSEIPHVMLKQTWDGNFGHWLIESLPRVETIRRSYGLKGFRYVVSDNSSPEMRKVYIDTLRAMGIEEQSIVSLPDDTWSIPKLIYPTPVTVQPWVKSPFAIRALEALVRTFSKAETEMPERIFVSRNNWSNRKLLNEEEIIEIARRQGYKVIHPEIYSISEQITIFSRAKLIVGTLGAALTNLVFACSGVNLLALAPEHMGDDFYWDLVALKGGRYMSLHGTSTAPEKGMHSDFLIDSGKFGHALDELRT